MLAKGYNMLLPSFQSEEAHLHPWLAQTTYGAHALIPLVYANQFIMILKRLQCKHKTSIIAPQLEKTITLYSTIYL